MKTKHSYRIQAFTVMELMIGIVLLGTIATISVSSIYGFQGNLFLYQEKAEKLNRIVQFQERMKYDFHNAQEVNRIENGILLISLDKEIEYRFQNSEVIRIENGIPAEFTMKVEQWETFKKGAKQLIPGQKIDAIRVQFDEKKGMSLYLKKDQTIGEKINEEIFSDAD